MSKSKRKTPKYLGKKLATIREYFGITQIEVLNKVAPWLDDKSRAVISEYESGKRVPSLIELINYASWAGTSVDTLIKDDIELEMKKLHKENNIEKPKNKNKKDNK